MTMFRQPHGGLEYDCGAYEGFHRHLRNAHLGTVILIYWDLNTIVFDLVWTTESVKRWSDE